MGRDDVAKLEHMVEDLRQVRSRRCQPLNQANPRYHWLSMAVSALRWVIEDLRDEDAPSDVSAAIEEVPGGVMAHVERIRDVSDRPWYTKDAATYRAEVRALAPKVLRWHGRSEERRYGRAQRHEAAQALGLPPDWAQMAGDAYYHLRDQGLVSVKREGPGATDWYWHLTDKGLDATLKDYLDGETA